jgi:hypothetical protein
MDNIVRKDGLDSIIVSRPVGDWWTCPKGHWLRDGNDVDSNTRVAVVIPSWEDGWVFWGDDHKIKDLQKVLAAQDGLFGPSPGAGYQRHTSIMLVDSVGCLGTFTSSSWGGHTAVAGLLPQYLMQKRRAFPICELRTKPRGDQFGNIDPVFRVVGWAPRPDFDAILGPEPVEAVAIAAPEKKAEPAPKRTSAEIIDDSIPF